MPVPLMPDNHTRVLRYLLIRPSQRWKSTLPIIVLLVALVSTGSILYMMDLRHIRREQKVDANWGITAKMSYRIFFCGHPCGLQDLQYNETQFLCFDAALQEIQVAMEDNSFVPTTAFTQAKSALDKNGIVIIKGRYGTGKSMIALRLAGIYANDNYKPYKIDIANITICQKLTEICKKRVIILDDLVDVFRVNPGMGELKRHCFSLLQCNDYTKIIVTAYRINRELKETLIPHFSIFKDIIVDLDNSNSLEFQDKERLLRKYLEKHDRVVNDTNAIVNSNPAVGFPLMCALFCSDESNFSMGRCFFTRPHPALVEKIEGLKNSGFYSHFESLRYTVLVYIAFNKKVNVINQNNAIDVETFKTIFRTVYQKDCLPDVSTITNAAKVFSEQYLDVNDRCEFIYRHQGFKEAVQITYGKINPKCVIENIPLDDMLTIIRPDKYQILPTEPVCQISHRDDSDTYNVFAQRLVHESLGGEKIAEKVGRYLKLYAADCSDSVLLEYVLNILNTAIKSRNIKDCTSALVAMFQEITGHSENCLPDRLEPICFRVTWEIICAAQNCKDSVLLQLVNTYIDLQRGFDVLLSVIDEYNNTLMHYLVVWGCPAGHLLLKKCQITTVMTNEFNFTPMHFAAYLARPVYLDMLLHLKHKQQETKGGKNKTTDPSMELEGSKAVIHVLTKGEKNAGKCVQLNEQKWLKLDQHIISKFSYGSKEQYETSRGITERFYANTNAKA